MSATKAPKSEKKPTAKKGRAPARKRSAKAAKASRSGRPSAQGAAAQRLRPGELDGLVLGYMRAHKAELPLSPSRIAKGIKRSPGAVANCLERLVKAETARLAKKAPREYDLEEVGSR